MLSRKTRNHETGPTGLYQIYPQQYYAEHDVFNSHGPMQLVDDMRVVVMKEDAKVYDSKDTESFYFQSAG